MPNLKSMEAARAGWVEYTSQTPRPSCEEINASLAASGHKAISPRMYKHYQRLERFGRHDYVPINELDIATRRR